MVDTAKTPRTLGIKNIYIMYVDSRNNNKSALVQDSSLNALLLLMLSLCPSHQKFSTKINDRGPVVEELFRKVFQASLLVESNYIKRVTARQVF